MSIGKWWYMAEGEGIEPASPLGPTVFETASSTNRTPSVMAVGVGVEPTPPGSGPDVLPLDHPTVVPRAGIEPAPCCSSGSRSTPELPRNGGKGGIRTRGPGRAPWSATRCFQPLSHLSVWRRRWDSNPRSPARQAGAFATMLLRRPATRGRARTCAPSLNRRLLYQLSYPGGWYPQQVPFVGFHICP